MRYVLLLPACLCFIAVATGCDKYRGTSARNDFIAKTEKLASEVGRQQFNQPRLSPNDVEQIFRSFLDASPNVELEGELKVTVIPFPNGGQKEPAELSHLPTMYKGNARNLAIRDRNVELIGVSGSFSAYGQVFNLEQWAVVHD